VLSKRSGVSIVLNGNGNTKLRGERLNQISAFPFWQCADLIQDSRVWVERPRTGNSHSCERPTGVRCVVKHLADSLQGVGKTTLGFCGAFAAMHDGSVFVHCAHRDFCSTDIDCSNQFH